MKKALKSSKFLEMYIAELKDIYNAEQQLIKALPKMEEAAYSEDLKEGYSKHLEQTYKHISRLEKVFEILNEEAEGKHCKAMKGLIAEGEEALNEYSEASYVRDVALIIASQKIEHYEISGYGNLIKIAIELDEMEICNILNETLNEEIETDKTLSDLISDTILQEAEEE
jgi:ferritin-like metal-binding protein YciE